MRYRIEIAYDGADFRGWAKQPGSRTVQSVLEESLGTVLRAPIRLTVAGRTDAGVHAWGQVACFDYDGELEPDDLRRLNGITPGDLAVLSVGPAPDTFDARRHARSRTYCYRLLNQPFADPFERGRSLWRSLPLDHGLLEACAESIRGSHDFTAFTPTETKHVRFEREILDCHWDEEPRVPGRPVIHRLWVEADSFLRGMVRSLVGTMLQVAGGGRTHADFVSLLGGATRPEAGPSAAAHGLYLVRVRYDDPIGEPRPH